MNEDTIQFRITGKMAEFMVSYFQIPDGITEQKKELANDINDTLNMAANIIEDDDYITLELDINKVDYLCRYFPSNDSLPEDMRTLADEIRNQYKMCSIYFGLNEE